MFFAEVKFVLFTKKLTGTNLKNGRTLSVRLLC